MNATGQNQTFNEKVAITQLTREFTIDLTKHNYFVSARRRGDVLNHGLRYRMLQAVKLFPQSTRLVAYHTEEKTAIGFLYLEENTDWLSTIEYVFVDPKYRKKGLATRLLKLAMILAKEKGARKVNLNVDANSVKTIELYREMGFKQIGCTLWVQGYLSSSATSRVIRRCIGGQGFLTKLVLEKKDHLYELETNSIKNREALFSIYKRCINQVWMDFFEIDAGNLINGSRHVWQPPFFKDVLVNDLANSFAIIFNSPFSSMATVELYSTSNVIEPSVLKDLLRILSKRGVSFTQIMLFNPCKNAFSSLSEKKDMMTYKFVAMGKTL